LLSASERLLHGLGNDLIPRTPLYQGGANSSRTVTLPPEATVYQPTRTLQLVEESLLYQAAAGFPDLELFESASLQAFLKQPPDPPPRFPVPFIGAIGTNRIGNRPVARCRIRPR
jgi:hypothetical protein